MTTTNYISKRKEAVLYLLLSKEQTLRTDIFVFLAK